MLMSPEERLREAWTKLPTHQQQELLDFAEFLVYRRTALGAPQERLSKEEHQRMITVLDAVAIPSQEVGPAVSNRNHDADLYGKS